MTPASPSRSLLFAASFATFGRLARRSACHWAIVARYCRSPPRVAATSRVRSAVLCPGCGGLIQRIRSPTIPVRFSSSRSSFRVARWRWVIASSQRRPASTAAASEPMAGIASQHASRADVGRPRRSRSRAPGWHAPHAARSSQQVTRCVTPGRTPSAAALRNLSTVDGRRLVRRAQQHGNAAAALAPRPRAGRNPAGHLQDGRSDSAASAERSAADGPRCASVPCGEETRDATPRAAVRQLFDGHHHSVLRHRQRGSSLRSEGVAVAAEKLRHGERRWRQASGLRGRGFGCPIVASRRPIKSCAVSHRGLQSSPTPDPLRDWIKRLATPACAATHERRDAVPSGN